MFLIPAPDGFDRKTVFIGLGLFMILLILLGALAVLYALYVTSTSAPNELYIPQANVTDIIGVTLTIMPETTTTSTLPLMEPDSTANSTRIRKMTEICQAVYSEGKSEGRVICRNITVWEDPKTGKKYGSQYNIVVH